MPGTAVQGDVVHAGPHDGQAAARLGQLGDRGLLRVSFRVSFRLAAPRGASPTPSSATSTWQPTAPRLVTTA